GRSPDVAPGEQLENAVRMRIERADEDVQVAVVVGDLRFGREPWIAVLPRLKLAKLRDGRGRAPYVVVVTTVDHHALRRAARRGGGGCCRRNAPTGERRGGGLDGENGEGGNRE